MHLSVCLCVCVSLSLDSGCLRGVVRQGVRHVAQGTRTRRMWEAQCFARVLAF
jgi:hypothetical protein